MKYTLKATHPNIPDINASFDTKDERTAVINDITKAGYAVTETHDLEEWETFTITFILPEGEPPTKLHERGLVTERFETELFELVKKYQGQHGLTITAVTSENEPIQQY